MRRTTALQPGVQVVAWYVLHAGEFALDVVTPVEEQVARRRGDGGKGLRQ